MGYNLHTMKTYDIFITGANFFIKADSFEISADKMIEFYKYDDCEMVLVGCCKNWLFICERQEVEK